VHQYPKIGHRPTQPTARLPGKAHRAKEACGAVGPSSHSLSLNVCRCATPWGGGMRESGIKIAPPLDLEVTLLSSLSILVFPCLPLDLDSLPLDTSCY
jgi:hypothetical protein